MRHSMLILVALCVPLIAAGGVYGDWFDDFEGYSIADPPHWWQAWASPGGQQVWFRETLDTGNIYNSRLVTTDIGGNSSQKIVGDPYNYGSTHSRHIGSYAASDIITVQAQVASTNLHGSWPLACMVWVNDVALGISGSNIAYGQMPLGQKIDAGNFASLMTKVGPTITANTWYDVKIVVRQALSQQADPNAPQPETDRVDLFYKAAADSEWTTIVTDLDTGRLLGENAKVAMKITNDTARGHIDNVGVQVRPGWEPIWTEDYEDYLTNQTQWYSQVGVPWDRVGSYNTHVWPETIGSNATNKLRGNSWNYFSWFQRPLGAACPTDRIVMTGQVATNAFHSTWPAACHIWLGGAAVGITGGRIAYGTVSIGEDIPRPNTKFTKIGGDVTANMWYDVMIVIHPGFDGQKNIADLYYKPETETYWRTVVTGLTTNHSFDGGQYAATVTSVGDYAQSAYLDNLALYFSPTEPAEPPAYEWEETYDSYSIPNPDTQWYWPTFWKRAHPTGYNSGLVTTPVGGNTTQKVKGEPYNYGAWHKNDVLDSWVLDKVGITQVVLTGQVAVDKTHTSWPFATHIWMGGVGVGIRGNRISYGNAPLGATVNVSNDHFNNLGPTIQADTWYDVMIVYDVESDTADLYYKPTADRECAWRLLVADWPTESELGNSIATVFCNTGAETNVGYIDNLKLATQTGCEQYIRDFGALPGDFTEDCNVGLADLAALAQQWLLGTQSAQ